jgi:hypothetical protein
MTSIIRINQIGSGLIITKPNSFGDQIQKSIAIELIIGYRTLIKPPQNLLSTRTYSTRICLPKLIPSQYTLTQGFRRTLSSQMTAKRPSTSRSQIDYWMQRVIRSAEKEPGPMRKPSKTLFRPALSPLERGSPAAWLEKNQGSERRRYCNPSLSRIKPI